MNANTFRSLRICRQWLAATFGGCLAALSAVAGLAESPQLLVNGGFEEGLKAWHLEGDVHLETNRPLAGKASAIIGPGAGSLAQRIETGHGNHLTVSATIQSQRTNGWLFAVRFLDKEGLEVMRVDSSADMETNRQDPRKFNHYLKAHPLTRWVELVITKTSSAGSVLVDEVGLDMQDENASNLQPTCDLDRAMHPFWLGNKIYNEAVLLWSQGGKSAAGQLMLQPSRIISIQDYSSVTNYSEGADYAVHGRTLVCTPSSRLPRVRDEDLPKGELKWNSIGGKQVLVSYEHEDASNRPHPGFVGDALPNTMKKLAAHAPLKVVAYGDSITHGLGESRLSHIPPFLPPWPELFVHRLKAIYHDEDIQLYNSAQSGADSNWGRKYAERMVASLNPDLVLIAFGQNDFWKVTASSFANNISEILQTVRHKNPHAEFLLVSTMRFDPAYTSKTQYWNVVGEYAAKLKAMTPPGVQFVDMTAISESVYAAKKPKDCLNDPLHPNDYLARWYAQSVVAALDPAQNPSPVALPSHESPSVAAPFRIQQQNGTAWLIRPTGERFFSLGVCCVEMGASRTNLNPTNPAYAAWQHYPDSSRWAQATIKRLGAWGFTTIGGWSDFHALRQVPATNVAFAPVLHIGSSAGAPWLDMWDPQITDLMDTVARDQILALRDDPRVLGYYSDNEMGWWNSALWKLALEQKPASGQRQKLLRLLRDTYRDDWNKLLQDFTPEKAGDWASLEQGGILWVKPGSGGFKVMRQFLGLMAERYYQLVHDIIRKYDRRALVLGDRYQSFYYPEVARASARWVDAVSSNLNASWDDGSYLRFYFDTLHDLTGKPILVSEFYSAASENQSGNRNLHGGFPVVRTQAQRAATLRNTLARLTRTPYVLGADWFQYFDEPPQGRGDGEDVNFGLVDIFDRPYDAVTKVFATFHATALKARPVAPASDASKGVPPAPRDPFADFVHMRALKGWDRERGFVQCSSPDPVADLYLCWSPKAIYLGLYAIDITEDALYRDRVVPDCDRGLWLVQAPGCEPLRVRLGASRQPVLNDSALSIRHLSGVNHNTRSITALALPAARLGRKVFRAGDTIQLSSTFWTHGQCYRMDWNGTYVLAN